MVPKTKIRLEYSPVLPSRAVPTSPLLGYVLWLLWMSTPAYNYWSDIHGYLQGFQIGAEDYVHVYIPAPSREDLSLYACLLGTLIIIVVSTLIGWTLWDAELSRCLVDRSAKLPVCWLQHFLQIRVHSMTIQIKAEDQVLCTLTSQSNDRKSPIQSTHWQINSHQEPTSIRRTMQTDIGWGDVYED